VNPDQAAVVWIVEVRPDGPFGWRDGDDAISDEDRRRMERMRVEADRHRLVVSRLALRSLVSSLWPESSEPPVIDHRLGHRPRLQAGALHLSLAHAGDWVMCAASPHPVGVDIELPLADPPDPLLIERTLTSGEQANWQHIESTRQCRAFARLWCRKEAALKACGHGLGVDPRTLDVRSSLLSCPADGATWELHDIEASVESTPGAAAAAPATAVAAPPGQPVHCVGSRELDDMAH
jgi:4'-phosphopantetheinyl transferase